MAITSANKEKLKSRLAKAIGHLNAVHRMVDEQKYCIDVLNQLKAVQAALDKTSEVILKQHLETCVVEAVNKQDSQRVIEELMHVFRKAPSLYADEDANELTTIGAAAAAGSGGGSGCCQPN
ncbi:MAG TPA: metal-sensitive transcriptional regulator [Oculatellaceae cyanobacterium]